jgi:hypothetical protein
MQTRTAPAAVEVAAVLVLDAMEAASLKAMLREQVTNDLDLLEDLAYADDLASPASCAACERVALAVRLDVALN